MTAPARPKARLGWALYWPHTGTIHPHSILPRRSDTRDLGWGGWKPIRVRIVPVPVRRKARRKK